MSATVPFCALEEIWISLASLLRSYTALHGLSGNRQAEIEQDEERIVARHGDKWLTLERKGAHVSWKREDGSCGELELTEAGRLKNGQGEEEMDLAAEGWARELMR
ncbi:MAG: transcriptional regulator [Terracidiphilus sp.]|nr:transcriptional regulator [Terracidiphilus sp.]